ncbi:MAG: diguanylate cyclase [Spirochaetes bacterium]|jgi:diguanylate cyclase (GGDEF)-like protein/putative nucleotidyltransferase with HDIG domain|nr:diguanylate cyclase [Spirochaetota bacterium]
MLLETLAAQLAPAIENASLFRDLAASYDHTLDALVAALDARDKETEGHSRRVVAYTLEIAQQLEVDAKDLATIRRGALLHDIGKIGVPDSILLKPGPLNEEERTVMMRHPQLGRQILAGIPFLKDPVEIVYAHQERFDGAGYPEGSAGGDIPFGARIFAVADTLDAITSDRPYRAGRPYEVAREEIAAHSGSQFDPQVVEAFLSVDSSRWDELRHEAMTIAAGESAFPLWQQSATGAVQLELDAINRLAARVSGFSDLEQALHSAARASVDSFGAASCGIFLREDGDSRLALKAHYLLPELVRRELGRFPLAGSHCETVMQERSNRVYDDLVDVPDFVQIGLPQERPDLGAYLCVPVVAGGVGEGILALFSRRPHSFDSHDTSVFRTLADAVGLAVVNARIAGATEPVAKEIPVVGERSELVTLVADVITADVSQGSTTALLLTDIDHFALYNETFGTTSGDEALHHIGQLLSRSVRSYDRIVSYGGGAFAVILRQTDMSGAKIVAEKMRLGIESLQLPYGALTSSLGLATTTHNPQPTALLTAAERALAAAKEGGRNCIREWTESV